MKTPNYYDPQGFALDIFRSRHAAHPNETWLEGCERVAGHVATAEEGEQRNVWKDKYAELLKRNLLMPGGRIWYGSGRKKGQLLNCFVIPTGDSREGWGKTVSDSIVISGTGGGVGLNCSPIRPKGSLVSGTGGTATGAVSLMQIVDAAGEVIKAGGGRRTALMLCLSIAHGDIVEFLDKKLDLKQLNNANVSVVFDDNPEEFFRLVRADKPFPLMFQSKQVGSIPAAELWIRIVKNALAGGEPGLLNGYLANKMSNIWYLEDLTSTNPCGEIWMSPYDCCCLGALVLPRFLSAGTYGSGKDVDWKLLKEAIHTGVRFLDDVLSINNYPLPEIKAKCEQLRRIGLGVTGLHDLLLELNLKYNSSAGLEFVDKLMKFIKNESYEASVDLAIEKGAFPGFDSEQFLKGAFIKTLKPSLRERIRVNGTRNCALNTIAPTGTISIVSGCSSGVESIFACAYRRKYRDGEALKEEVVVHPLFKTFVERGLSTSHFQGAHELSIRDHLEMQRVCQLHVDNAVSKTINLPHGTSVEDLSKLYMEFFPDLKGVTVYPDGSRENQPLTPLSQELAEEYAFNATAQAAGNDNCKTGNCDV